MHDAIGSGAKRDSRIGARFPGCRNAHDFQCRSHIPELDSPVGAGRNQSVAVGTKADATNATRVAMKDGWLQPFAILEQLVVFPKGDCAILMGGSQRLSIGAITQIANWPS